MKCVIFAGTNVIVALTPVIVNTSETVISRFTPLERGCYTNEEFHLKLFPWDNGYRYSLTNCLNSAVIERILQNCSCLPDFYKGEENLLPCRYTMSIFFIQIVSFHLCC
jgi:hypothetical protein